MRPFVSPEFVFERDPSPTDRAIRAVKTVGMFAAVIAARPESGREFKSEKNLRKANEDLRQAGLDFFGRWRENLKDEKVEGRRIWLLDERETNVVDAYITFHDYTSRFPDNPNRNETTLFAGVSNQDRTQSYFLIKNIYDFFDDPVQDLRINPILRSQTYIYPAFENGEHNNEGFGSYTFSEAAGLNMTGIRIMREIDKVHELGRLGIAY